MNEQECEEAYINSICPPVLDDDISDYIDNHYDDYTKFRHKHISYESDCYEED
jgi:hypothetical protein